MKSNNENIKRRVPAPSSSELTSHAVYVLRVSLDIAQAFAYLRNFLNRKEINKTPMIMLNTQADITNLNSL